MATHDLNLKLDRSIPLQKLTTFPRVLSWADTERVVTSDRTITLRLVMDADLESLSPRWAPVYHYGITTEVDASGTPVFRDYPHGSVEAVTAILECPLSPGIQYIMVHRDGGVLRDWRGSAPLMGQIIWSKAKVSAFLIVQAEGF